MSVLHKVAESLWAFNLTLLLLLVAFILHSLTRSRVLTSATRGFLVDFALTIATGICILVSYAPVWSSDASIHVERIDLNDEAYKHDLTIQVTIA